MRLAELLVGFSAVADLGMGLPIGEAARTAIVAVNLARGAGCPEPEVSDVFFAALRPHGHGRTRTVRGVGAQRVTHTPRRARCGDCGRTQILPVSYTHLTLPTKA